MRKRQIPKSGELWLPNCVAMSLVEHLLAYQGIAVPVFYVGGFDQDLRLS